MKKFMDALLTNFSAELQKDDKPKRVLLVLDVEVVAVAVSLWDANSVEGYPLFVPVVMDTGDR